MKKLFSLICLLIAFSSVYAQNFVPTAGEYYNIIQTSSNLVVGPTLSGGFSTTQPSVVTLTNQRSQAFQFVPVEGKADTYYLLNNEGMYLNMLSGVDWNTWTTIFEAAPNALYSEWVISGADADNIRLMLNQNSKYLASDGITSGSSLYCDKGVDSANGLFKLSVATIDNKPVFTLLEKNIVIEIEKELQPYPLYVVASGQNYDIKVTPSTGFYVEKTTFTPADFTNASGKLKIDIHATTANIGDTGKVVFSYALAGTTYKLDSVQVTPVANYERYYFKNKTSGLVVGNHTTAVAPALTTQVAEDYTQYFILRPVHKGVNDSLFYIIQDGEYRMVRKTATSGWDTEFGFSGDEAIWKITPQANGANSIINFVTGKALGTDDIIVDSRLYDDKTFSVDPVAKPYCEWLFESVSEGLDETNSELVSVSLSAGLLSQNFNAATTTYDILAPIDLENITITATSKSSVATINNNSAQLSATSPSAVISCVSANGLSTTNYTFNYSELGFADWAARGETNAAKSKPSQWGWKCANITWASANSTTAGTARYIDNPANYYYLGDTLNVGVLADTVKYKGRVMYVRWDGTVTTTGVYSYPVKLSAGVKYIFKGKYAWNSVVPTEVTAATFTFGINSVADNTGLPEATFDYQVESTDLLHLHDASFDFTPSVTGIYYFTVQNNAAILGALADLSITTATALPNNTDNSIFATVNEQGVMLCGTTAGDAIKVYNVNGQLQKQLTAPSNVTSLNLKSGIYVIKVNSTVIKIVK